jgi:UDP-N-acetylglucosamine 2-epimerase (non-hydrolysing)
VAKLVGTDRARIVEEGRRLLADEGAYVRMATAVQPYGDGGAGERIAQLLSAARDGMGRLPTSG